MTGLGHNPNCRPIGLCQLWPAADMRLVTSWATVCRRATCGISPFKDVCTGRSRRAQFPVAVEFQRRKACLESGFLATVFMHWSLVIASSSTFPSRTVGWLITTRPCTALKVRAAPTSLPTLFPSSTGSRLSPSSSHRAIHDMAQTGRSNVRYVDPQRRHTAVLGPSWNALFRPLPHDDRAGTHDSADGRCGSYASIGRGQAATKIFRRYPQPRPPRRAAEEPPVVLPNRICCPLDLA